MLTFAITIHKSQGLSLNTAIVVAGPTNFGCGMVYVALSRVTSLGGLHLIDLDRSKIACDRKAVDEYNRLRRLYAPHLGDLKATAAVRPFTIQSGHENDRVTHSVTKRDQTVRKGAKVLAKKSTSNIEQPVQEVSKNVRPKNVNIPTL